MHTSWAHRIFSVQFSGFVNGWAMSKRCFQRQDGFKGNHAGEYTPVMFESHAEMVEAIKHDEVI